jgi:DNA repair protein RecO (recombination protein O)
MLHKTRGIVLHHIKYSETSLIVKIFTELFGLQAYLVKGARSKKSTLRSSHFQPMTMLDLVVYHREKSDLQHIRESEISKPFLTIFTDIRKSTIALFLAEMLLKTLKEDESNSEMFDFISSSLNFFEIQKDGIENFHLFFLIKLSRYLGFYPQGAPGSGNAFFDLREGRYTDIQPLHPDFLNTEKSVALHAISSARADELSGLVNTKTGRSELLNAILIYYQIHLGGLSNIKSIEVLKEVFR